MAAGELELSFISIRSPRRLCLFNWQRSPLSITARRAAGRHLGGNMRTNERPFLGVFCTGFISLEVECETESNVFILSPDGC